MPPPPNRGRTAGAMGITRRRLAVAVAAGLVASLAAVAAAVYAFDVYLLVTGNRWGDHHFSVSAIPGGDSRPRWRVVADMRSTGIRSYPAAHPNRLPRPLRSAAGPLLPLGGVSNVATVLCNETGRYLVFESDEFGFNNPKGVWRPSVDMVAVGDSFTQGLCPPAAHHMIALIRRRFPATVNLGSVANGPLAMLGGIAEFVPFLRPRVVLWFHL